jgi:hypothetical protein
MQMFLNQITPQYPLRLKVRHPDPGRKTVCRKDDAQGCASVA